MKQIFLFILFTSLISCHEKEGDFVFTYGCGTTKNELNTTTGVYIKDMITEPSIAFNMELSSEQKNQIIAKVKEIELKTYPENNKGTQCEPQDIYSMKIKLNGKFKTVKWDGCPGKSKDGKYEKLMELSTLIMTIIQHTPEYKSSPKPSGGYL